jgi:porin
MQTPHALAYRTCGLTLAIGWCAFATVAGAEPETAPAPAAAQSGFGLAGEWGGLRTHLANDGLTFSGGYVSELAYNAQGGDRQEADEAGEIDLGVTVDLQRMAGVPGGVFKATATDRRGRNLVQDAGLGLLEEVQEINGRGHTWRLTEFWYEQTIGAVRLKVGRSPPNTDFAAFSCEFQNLSFCSAAPGNTVTGTWFNWPIGQWSAHLRIDGSQVYVQAGAYVINPRDLDLGFTLGHLNGATGVLYPVEVGWTPTFAGHPGTYKIGAWRSTADAPDPRRGPSGGVASPVDALAPPRSSRSGVWIDVVQQLSGGSGSAGGGSGLSVFFNFMQADRHTAQIDQQIATGLFYGGLLPGRPQDVAGLGLARTHLNNSAGAARRGPGAPLGPEGAELLDQREAAFVAQLSPAGWRRVPRRNADEIRPNVSDRERTTHAIRCSARRP